MPSVVTNNNSVGSVGWSNLLNGISSNNSYVSCGTLLGILGSAQTNYIRASGYGFAIPTTATVCGIEVRVERNASGLLIGSSVTDKNVYLMKSGSSVGTNHASGAGWTSSDVVAVYGSNSDLWGTSWTPTQLNASNFGVLFSAQMNAGLASLFLTANVDDISVTVYYTASTLPVELISFAGQVESQTIHLNWKTAGETKNTFFEVEKMTDDYHWEVVAHVAGQGNSVEMNNYNVYDKNPESINYYRLRQFDQQATGFTSGVISIEFATEDRVATSVYPIPCSSILYVDTKGKKVWKLEVISSTGKQCQSELQQSDTGYTIPILELAPGLYFLRVYTYGSVETFRFLKE